MNVELLEKVKTAILADASHFDMRYFAAKSVPGCGTVMCIAGHALHIGKGLTIEQIIYGKPFFDAKELLGITDEQAESLFILSFWPDDLVDKWYEANFEQKSKLAGERIDRFIKDYAAV